MEQDAPGALQAARLSAGIVAADGWFDACFIFVWQVALFVSLGESIAAYGGAMALAGLVGAVCGLLLGRHIDAGHGRRAVIIVSVMATVLMLMRAASLGSPWLAVDRQCARLAALADAHTRPRDRDVQYGEVFALPFRFHLATEGGWESAASPAASWPRRLRQPAPRWRSRSCSGCRAWRAGMALLWRYYSRPEEARTRATLGRWRHGGCLGR